jgi:hypothetical protein
MGAMRKGMAGRMSSRRDKRMSRAPSSLLVSWKISGRCQEGDNRRSSAAIACNSSAGL